ncbi:MAG: transposase, partial [Coriobacteriales bacterium]|nr:transposase [Coriobacteriales bacterium]
FENSSVPSSKQVVRRKRVPNTRESTGRRPGAQPGHPHHPRRRPEPTRVVEIADPEGWEADPDLYRTGKTTSRLVVSARVAVEVTEYVANEWRRRSTGGRLHAPFPEGATDEVSYDGSCKALAFPPANECCASLAKASAFLREASGGALEMSVGMLCGLAREFSAKSEPERRGAVESPVTRPVMHADLASANVGGEMAQVLILANGEATMMLAREHKGHEGVAGTPLEGFVGCVSHDHDVTFYSYGTSHQECMQHMVRYLVGSTQNEPHLSWNSRMLSHVRAMVHWRNSLPPGGKPEPGEVAALEREYDVVLELAAAEYGEHPPDKYYREGYNLFVRMRDYRKAHLLFLHDPRVEPDNSICERKARVFKRKQHACTCFRSFEGLAFACEAIAAIDNMRAAGEDVLAAVTAIFRRPLPVGEAGA